MVDLSMGELEVGSQEFLMDEIVPFRRMRDLEAGWRLRGDCW
jgi:hypothetical protein